MRKSEPRSSRQSDYTKTIIKRRNLQCYGNVSRSSGPAKTTLQSTVKGGRRKAKQRKRWEDNIREWTGLELAKSQRAVENREEWRKLVMNSSVVHQQPSQLRDRWGEMREPTYTSTSWVSAHTDICWFYAHTHDFLQAWIQQQVSACLQNLSINIQIHICTNNSEKNNISKNKNMVQKHLPAQKCHEKDRQIHYALLCLLKEL